MGMILKEILDPDILQTLLSNHDPALIRQDQVAQAAKELIKAIKLLELYPSEQLLIDRLESLRKNYPSIYTHRTFYLWQMCQTWCQLTSLNLSDIDSLQTNSLKFQTCLTSVLLDDICDMGRDKAVFDKCVLALEGDIYHDHYTEIYQLIADIWSGIQNAIEQAPNYVLLKPAFEDAYQKWIASFEYSLAIQEESFLLGEKWERHLEIIAHSTIVYLVGLIDLLFVPNLAAHQVSSASEIFLRTQKMLEITNWISTWERELVQRDFTSGVYAIALENGWIEWNDLKSESLEKVRQQIRNSPVEGYLWREWERLRVESHQILRETQLPSFNGYVDSFSVMMLMQIFSAGKI